MFSQEVDLTDVMGTIFLKNKTNKQIQIFGENHATKLKKKNTFTELIPLIEEAKCLVLVEHSTILCNLEGTPPEIEKMMLATGGGDTIFVNLVKSKYPKLVCFDNRLENGFFTGMEESQYMRMLVSITPDMKPAMWQEKVKVVLSEIMKKAKLIIRDILPLGKPYDELEYVKHLSVQIMILDKITDLDLNADTIYNGLPNGYLFIQIIINLLKNIIRIGSLYVDLNLINLIDKSKEEKIVVFTGKNHLDRLYIHYSDTYDIHTKNFEFDGETSNVLPVNDFGTDLSILESIEDLLKQSKAANSPKSAKSANSPANSPANSAANSAKSVKKKKKKKKKSKKS